MANEEHVAILKKGVATWNAWRDENRDIRPDLGEADLGGANLSKANLSGADLSGADLSKANLLKADLSRAGFSEANLFKANLSGADFREADLRKADLRKANLRKANLRKANLRKANLSEAFRGGWSCGASRPSSENCHRDAGIRFWQAIKNAILVFGTIDYFRDKDRMVFAAVQILLDFLLLAIVLATLIGRVGQFEKR